MLYFSLGEKQGREPNEKRTEDLTKRTKRITLAEEDLALALSEVSASDQNLQPILEEVLSCTRHPVTSPMLFRVQRMGEIMGLVQKDVPDPYQTWLAVYGAAERGEPGSSLLEKVGFITHLLLEEEEKLRFNCPRQGLEAMKTARDVADELDPPSGREHLVDSASLESPREPGRFTALRALVEARYGNALRYNSRNAEALRILAPAILTARTFNIPTSAFAEICWLYSVALFTSGQSTSSLYYGRRSVESYSTIDSHRAGVVMIHLAKVLYQTNSDPAESLLVVNAAIGQLDEYRSYTIWYGGQLVVVFYSLKANKFETAEAVLSRLPKSQDKTLDLKREGLLGVLELSRSDYLTASETLAAVSYRYIDLSMPCDAALVMLYQSEALLGAGQFEGCLEVLQSAYRLLSAMGTHEAEVRDFKDLLHITQVATIDQLIGRIRNLADRLGGCLPTHLENDGSKH